MASEHDVTTSGSARASARLPYGKLAPLAAILLVAAILVALGWHRAFSLESLVKHRAAIDSLVDRHFVAALAGFVVVYVVVVALSLPGALLLTITAGILFGWLVGGLAAIAGATGGATIIFVVARRALCDYVHRKAGPRLAKLSEGFRADAFHYLLFLRLVPVFPFWLVNLAPALLGVRLRTFVLATVLGIIPATFAYAFVGAGIESVIAAQEAAYKACLAAGRADCQLDFDLKAAVTPTLLAALTALGLLALLPALLRRWRTPPTCRAGE